MTQASILLRRAPACALLLAASLVATPAAASEVEVLVSGGSPGGQYYVALFRGEEAFEQDERLQAVNVGARSGATRVAFTGLAPGEYCISAFYDADGDGKLTRNLLGIPKEPYGFSRNARGRFGPPSFEEASFRVGDEPQRLEMTLR